jgi:hypothetical protein
VIPGYALGVGIAAPFIAALLLGLRQGLHHPSEQTMTTKTGSDIAGPGGEPDGGEQR